MLLPETYQAALLLMILTMLCWGSWANTLKLCPGFRFQLFYWDYAFGLAAGAIVLGLTGGSFGHSGPTFLSDLAHTPDQTLSSSPLPAEWSSTSPTFFLSPPSM